MTVGVDETVTETGALADVAEAEFRPVVPSALYGRGPEISMACCETGDAAAASAAGAARRGAGSARRDKAGWACIGSGEDSLTAKGVATDGVSAG